MSALGLDKTLTALDRMVGSRVGVWVGARGGAHQRFHVSGVLAAPVEIATDPDTPEAEWNGPGTLRYAFEDIDGWGLLLDPATFAGSSEIEQGLRITLSGGLEFVVALG